MKVIEIKTSKHKIFRRETSGITAKYINLLHATGLILIYHHATRLHDNISALFLIIA